MPQNDSDDNVNQERGEDGANVDVSPNQPSGEEAKARTDAEQTAQIKKLNRKVIGAWVVAAFGPLIALIGLVFSGLQWKAAEGQLDVMRAQLKDARDGTAQARKDTDAVIAAAKRQADSMDTLAKANREISLAARTSADNSAMSLRRSDEQFRLSQRPVLVGNGVSITSSGASLIGDKADVIFFYIWNAGKSSALDCRVSAGFVFGRPPLPPVPELPIVTMGEIGAGVSQFGPILLPPFTDDDRREFFAGRKMAWVVVRATYRDQLGNKYAFEVNYLYVPVMNLWIRDENKAYPRNGQPPPP